MRAGKLRHRVMIQSAVELQSASGEISVTWGNVQKWWAEISPMTAREFISGEQRIAEVSHKITIRYCSFLTVRHRIEWQGRVFEISAILNTDERNREQVIMSNELV